MTNNKKIFNVIYGLSIVTLTSCVFMFLYYLIYNSPLGSSGAQAFGISNGVCLGFAVLTIASVIINLILQEKHFWLEAIMTAASIVGVLVLIIVYANTMAGTYATYEMARFEMLGALILMLISRSCLYVISKKEKKNEK